MHYGCQKKKKNFIFILKSFCFDEGKGEVLHLIFPDVSGSMLFMIKLVAKLEEIYFFYPRVVIKESVFKDVLIINKRKINTNK